MTCLRCHIHFCSYCWVGLGVVQMVRYFKTSHSISFSATQHTFKVRNAVTRSKPTNIPHIRLSAPGKKPNTLLAPLNGYFTLNMSWNTHGAAYFASCEKVPTCTFLLWYQVAYFVFAYIKVYTSACGTAIVMNFDSSWDILLPSALLWWLSVYVKGTKNILVVVYIVDFTGFVNYSFIL